MNCSYFFRVNRRRLLPVWAATQLCWLRISTAVVASCAGRPLGDPGPAWYGDS